MNSKLLRGALAASLCVHISIHGLGCGGHDDDEHVHPTGASGAVIYEGAATDEALLSVAGVAAKPDDSRAAALQAPLDGATLPRDPAPTFTWSAGSARATPRTRALDWGPLARSRSAHAHGEAVTGVVYHLVLSTPKAPRLVEVLTTKTDWKPSAETWAKLVADGGPVTATLVTARLEQNRLAPDGGPFAPTRAVTFTVAP